MKTLQIFQRIQKVNVRVSELNLQADSNKEFARQVEDQVNDSNWSENQVCKQVSQVGDSIAESCRQKVTYVLKQFLS